MADKVAVRGQVHRPRWGIGTGEGFYRNTSGYTWELEPAEVFEELAIEFQKNLHQIVLQIAQRWAPKIENWMKDNAPWTDRTGNARQTLHTAVQDVVGEYVSILLSHGVEYGMFLEVKNGGKYAIINPALDEFGPRVWSDVRRVVGV